ETFLKRGQDRANLIHSKSWSNVLLTVPVERIDMNRVDAFNKGILAFITDYLKKFFRFSPLRDLRMTKNLQACLAWIVNENQCDTVVRQEIARTDVLFIPTIISKSECLVVQNFKESFRSATMLYIRPSSTSDACHIKAVTFAYKFPFVRTQSLIRRALGRKPFILTSASI